MGSRKKQITTTTLVKKDRSVVITRRLFGVIQNKLVVGNPVAVIILKFGSVIIPLLVITLVKNHTRRNEWES
jgi:hypothetical protein